MMRYLEIWSNGKASLSCCITQSAEGWLVILKWRIFLRLWSIIKNTNKILKLIVGTMKKSIAEITSRWFFRKVIHDCCFFLSGCSERYFLKYLDTLASDTSLNPSINNSEKILGAPQRFSPAIRKIKLRISFVIRLRPGFLFLVDIWVQCFLNRRFCQSIIVSGLTIIKQLVHLFLECFKAIQKKRSIFFILGFVFDRWNVVNCWRRVRFSKISSLFDIASFCNPKIRRWIEYYGIFYRSALCRIFREFNRALFHWANQKYKKIKGSKRKFFKWLKNFAKVYPNLFEHWKIKGVGVSTVQ